MRETRSGRLLYWLWSKTRWRFPEWNKTAARKGSRDRRFDLQMLGGTFWGKFCCKTESVTDNQFVNCACRKNTVYIELYTIFMHSWSLCLHDYSSYEQKKGTDSCSGKKKRLESRVQKLVEAPIGTINWSNHFFSLSHRCEHFSSSLRYVGICWCTVLHHHISIRLRSGLWQDHYNTPSQYLQGAQVLFRCRSCRVWDAAQTQQILWKWPCILFAWGCFCLIIRSGKSQVITFLLWPDE